MFEHSGTFFFKGKYQICIHKKAFRRQEMKPLIQAFVIQRKVIIYYLMSFQENK